ncbi:DUF4351 domain-containing protein [Geminocystis herdmanii]|uniref:DUF4351 domain-containing protein n=1 Tax=Geminocystis herdmanii TaxID=669359 RepID=UPI00034B43BB|nr:DUF4351 domain-containing protein [Geminocystis herdmanii]
MSQFPHDEFVKEYLPELYQQYGQVIPSADVTSERRQIDVLFIPIKPVPTTPETLGLLGRLGQTTCLLEVYRNPVTIEEIWDCLGKLVSVRQNHIKDAKREKRKITKTQLPFLWIITPTISKAILKEFDAVEKGGWEDGIYFLASGFRIGIIAIHQLPVTRDTLWLRILGKGNKQIQAIEQLKALPSDYPNREIVLELVYGLLSKLTANQRNKQETIKEDETLIMSLRQLYRDKIAEVEKQGIQQGIQQGLQQGIQQGLQQGIQQRLQQEINMFIRLLKRKIGNVSPELENRVKNIPMDKLEDFGEALLDFNSPQDLTHWLDNYS